MQLYVQDLVRDAMGVIGAVKKEESPSTDELNLGIRQMNVMIDQWSAAGLMIRTTTEDNFPLIAGTYSYTIGPSAALAFNTPKPLRVRLAWIRDATGVDTTLDIVSRQIYDAFDDKSFAQSRPEFLFYDPGQAQQSAPNHGTVFLYPIPDPSISYTLYLESDKYLTEFVNPTDLVTFEPAYYEALIWNLGVRLFYQFHAPKVPIPPLVMRTARDAVGVIEALNHELPSARIEVPGIPSAFNIYSGDTVGGW